MVGSENARFVAVWERRYGPLNQRNLPRWFSGSVAAVTYRGRMTVQPRRPAGGRCAGVSEGGRFASKTVPDVTDTVGFNDDTVETPLGWTERTVTQWGLRTTFTRSVNDAGEVSVTADCDDPSLMLLTRKGDFRYWSDETWQTNYEERRLWCADIARQMLEEGLVATGLLNGDAGIPNVGIRAAMTFASSPRNRKPITPVLRFEPHTLTGLVAQIRGLRLLQSMAPPVGWRTKLGGYDLPYEGAVLLYEHFNIVAGLYRWLRHPPWQPDGVEWGSQTAAGHATTVNDDDIFVGEHGDLVWCALTETDRHGMSPLKTALQAPELVGDDANKEMICAAALYDETAEAQLTTGLFDGAGGHERREGLKRNALGVLNHALNPTSSELGWTPEQQDQIRGFITAVEALNP